MFFYKTNLTLGFMPFIGKDQRGFDQYDKKKFLSVAINHEKAAALYLLSKSIIEGTQGNPKQLLIQCNKQATLLFEYKPNQNEQMRAYITLEKQGEKIPFEFQIRKYNEKVDDQVVVKIVHTGLLTFAAILNSYISAVGADRHFNKPAANETGDPQAFTWM